MRAYNVGILGATGLVGQNLVRRLNAHPWFRITALCASERSAGRTYAEAVDWKVSADPPGSIARQRLRLCRVDEVGGCDVVFSGLDRDVARRVEPEFARAGVAVISNSSAYRADPTVPLIVPEINASHLRLIEGQSFGAGYIVTNPNCSATGLAMVAAPIDRAFGIRRMVVTTMQAVSGAGVRGPAAIDMLDNVVPYIPGEEEKIERELAKLLGTVRGGRVVDAELVVSANCHRVSIIDGHLASVSLELATSASSADVAAALRAFRTDIADLDLPSGAAPPLLLREEPDRPQPRLDRGCGDGMTVVVGRLRACPVLGVRLEVLSHNTVRGAAGGSLLNAELLAARGSLPRRGST